MDAPKFSSFLIKVASRCNLDCDYCYVYHHADQSWKSLPKLLSTNHVEAFAERLNEYAKEQDLKRCAIIYHGGEPLLCGVQNLVDFTNIIREKCALDIDFSMQTNGLLLDEESINAFAKAGVGISLSLDGPKSANDKHRLTVKGRSSFEKTELALKVLQNYPDVFSGVIAVIDTSTSPDELFEYFDHFQIPRLDFLLPDAHWLRLPPGRNQDPGLYEEWLVNAFDLWLDKYSHIQLRTFEALLDVCSGLPSTTDTFGFGDVSLLSIETDGSYHDLDVLKVTQEGATCLFGNVYDTSIAEVARSKSIQRHRHYLTKDGLSAICKACDVVDICGGGSLPHRFGENGFNQPTVYCSEFKRLITHINNRLSEHLLSVDFESEVTNTLPEELDLSMYELAETSFESVKWLAESAENEAVSNFRHVLGLLEGNELAKKISSLPDSICKHLAVHPGTIAWVSALISKSNGGTLYSVDGNELIVSLDYLEFLELLLNSKQYGHSFDNICNDEWLRAPFGNAIYFENEALTIKGRCIVGEALAIINNWRPMLAKEMLSICKAVQFVRDPTADPNKIVSFSDNTVPGALYVSIYQGDKLIDPYDLADSLIHEYRHQKLYLLERHASTVLSTKKLIISPWREDLRPPSGLFHAIFVFVELRRFWMYVLENGPSKIKNRALNQISDTNRNLEQAFLTLMDCPLTDVGQSLANVLKRAAS